MNRIHKVATAALAAFIFASPASAQNAGSVTNHAFVLGKGAGTTGYTSLLCGSAQLAVGQSAADPICKTITGDVTLSAAGALTIGALKVTNSMLAGSIAASKLIGTDIATVGTITAGTWNGTTIAVANGGTGATSASGARTNLGVAIGSNVQAWDADLDAFALKTAPTGAVVGTSDTQTLTGKTFNCANNTCTVRLASDITGFGTGVATALAVNVGSAGAPVVNGGALGTPSSGTATNLTGTASGLTAGDVANSSVIAKVLTAFSASAGTVSSSDSILMAFQKVVGNIALKLNAASPAMTGTADVQGTLKASSFVTATQITASQNNYTATDGTNTCSTKLTLRLSSNGALNVTGLSCGQAEGDLRIIHNVGSNNIVLTNQDTNSTAANRFLFGGDITLGADTSVTLRYDSQTSRWRAITSPGAGGGGGGVTSVSVAAGNGIGVSGTCTITTSGTCTVSQADAERQNATLDRIYQSKLLGATRRVVKSWADGYKASDGINSGSSSNYILDTVAGNVSPSLSSTQVTINANSITAGNGTLTMVDRTTAVLNSQTVASIGFYSTSAVSGAAVKIVKRNSAGNYDVVVTQTVNHPGGGFVDFALSSPYAVPASGTYYLAVYNPNSGSIDATVSVARAYANGNVTGTGQTFTEGTASTTPMRYAYITGVASMTVITAVQTADASASNARVLLEFDNTSTPTLNTDLTVEVTCNSGTNWATATLSAVTANSQSGHSVAETADTACTAGTSIAARVKTANGKSVPVYGVGLTWR